MNKIEGHGKSRGQQPVYKIVKDMCLSYLQLVLEPQLFADAIPRLNGIYIQEWNGDAILLLYISVYENSSSFSMKTRYSPDIAKWFC